jgi:hypothetical protein
VLREVYEIEADIFNGEAFSHSYSTVATISVIAQCPKYWNLIAKFCKE